MLMRFLAAIIIFLHANFATGAQDRFSNSWRYTLEKPAGGWQSADFDDSGWKTGTGGFGTRGTPGARVGTEWKTNDIWLRQSIGIEKIPSKPVLLIQHDEDAEVFLNGQSIVKLSGYTQNYQLVPIDTQQYAAIKTGENLLAVHCHQTAGGQFIDVHFGDAENPPKLPAGVPFRSELMTQWGAEVTAENAWTEYPRPQLMRSDWKNLNGFWDYAVTPIEKTAMPKKWDGRILVPFCLESKLGGVQRLLDAREALWYRRVFAGNPATGQRTLLNFEAVDYRCEVFINEKSVGKHVGGNTPFAFDITAAIKSGDNELVVRVEDETEGWQLHGKQVINPHAIWYTQVSGIWQTVWLEQVNNSYIKDLTIVTDAMSGTIKMRADVENNIAENSVRVIVRDGDQVVAESSGPPSDITATVKDAKLWSPISPQLYDLDISLLNPSGKLLDQVTSYAGIRTVGKTRDADGNLRMTLNNETIFHWGPLDQGWWPDGLLTPPSDEAMLFDVQWLKAAGFNMIRKHIKVEPRRYYYHCDRLGMMVWQDQVSSGNGPRWTLLEPNPQDAQWPAAAHQQFMAEFEAMIDDLENHPSIVVWVPFNESWGQHQTLEVGKWVVQRDPNRLVNIASGGNFWPIGDIVDRHEYPHPMFPFDADRYRDFIKVVGEFGGHGYPVAGHLWDAARKNWGYGGLPKTKEEYQRRYVTSLEKLIELKQQGVAAGVYTQTTDVEGEINGLLTYDRKVIKIPAEELYQMHQTLLDSAGN